SRSSANTSPGTRIFPRAGIRKRQSSTGSISSVVARLTKIVSDSDVEYDPHPPGAAAAGQSDLMIRHRLDLASQLVPGPVERLAARRSAGQEQSPVDALDRELGEQQPFRLGAVHELAQPAHQQVLQARSPNGDPHPVSRPDGATVADQIERGQ